MGFQLFQFRQQPRDPFGVLSMVEPIQCHGGHPIAGIAPRAQRAGPFDREAYRQRNLIERGINKLKWLRRIATRYEKLAVHYLALLKLAILFRFYLG